MKREWNLNWLIYLTTLLLVFLCVYLLLKLAPIWEPIVNVLTVLIVPFLIASLITYLLHPIVEKIHKEGLPRGVAVLLIYLLFFGGTGYAIVKGIPHIVKQSQELMENVPMFIDMYRDAVHHTYDFTANLPPALQEKVDQSFQDAEDAVNHTLTLAIEIAKKLLSSIFIIMIIPFIVFYLLKDFEDLKKIAWRVTPPKWRIPGRNVLIRIDESLGNYIRGQFFVISVLGVLAALGFWLIKLPYAILLGIIVGVTDIIPYFGPFLGAAPALLIASTVSVKMTLVTIIVIIVLQFIESNILSPYIVGKSLHIHPVVIIFGLLAGGEIAGVIGLILAVPVLAVLKALILYRNEDERSN
ncbi:AI-2E family transporter [Pseudalkalibacillus hwajinpoensis]|uniref:AI-2E family transporter n=1 Tax=Guptibacillus hwajinpoensis TaxID=208199 RepID=UPI001CD7517E|nr:AI-2E family transporter [Pseudalkalibacillus hwajinpoensis]